MKKNHCWALRKGEAYFSTHDLISSYVSHMCSKCVAMFLIASDSKNKRSMSKCFYMFLKASDAKTKDHCQSARRIRILYEQLRLNVSCAQGTELVGV